MMSSSSFLMARAVVVTMAAGAVLAATAAEAAGSYYIPTPASPDFLLSPVFLWVTANVIIVWLLSSSRRRGRAANDDDVAAPSSADNHDGEAVPGAVDSFYAFSSSEYGAFSDAAPVGRRADDAPAVSSKRLTREARAAARRSDRARVRKKPEPAGQDAPTTRTSPPWDTVVVAEARHEPPARDERRGQAQADETAPAVAVAAAADADAADDEDVSMDSLWASIVQRRAARPVVVRKSESWSNEELPRLQRVAETAAARRQVRKSVSAVAKAAAAAVEAPTTQPPPTPSRQTGWRTRDVLISISPDELLRRAESFIRRQREHLRLQRQESEQRQLLLQRRLHGHAPAPAPLIRAGV